MSHPAFTNLPQARDFLDTIEPALPAYSHGVFTYVALHHNTGKVILRARFELVTRSADSVQPFFETANFSAGQIQFEIDASAAETCIRLAVAGEQLPSVSDQFMRLLPRPSPDPLQGYGAYYEPRQPADALRSIGRLVLSGIGRYELLNPRTRELEGELRNKGVDSIDELLRIYKLGGSNETTLEFVATPVAAFDRRSNLKGRRVALAFRLAQNLPQELFTVIAVAQCRSECV